MQIYLFCIKSILYVVAAISTPAFPRSSVFETELPLLSQSSSGSARTFPSSPPTQGFFLRSLLEESIYLCSIYLCVRLG